MIVKVMMFTGYVYKAAEHSTEKVMAIITQSISVYIANII